MINQLFNTVSEFFNANASIPEVQSQPLATCQEQLATCQSENTTKILFGILLPAGAALTALASYICYEGFRKKTEAEIFAEAKARVALAAYSAFVTQKGDLKIACGECKHMDELDPVNMDPTANASSSTSKKKQ